jgi:hypothetical protein
MQIPSFVQNFNFEFYRFLEQKLEILDWKLSY